MSYCSGFAAATLILLFGNVLVRQDGFVEPKASFGGDADVEQSGYFALAVVDKLGLSSALGLCLWKRYRHSAFWI